MAGAKWSDDTKFPQGGTLRIGDEIVGLRNDANNKFTLDTGFGDGNGNYIIAWETVGAAATDYLKFINGESGTNPSINALGDSTDVGIDINTQGDGLIVVNSSKGFDVVLDEDDMSSDDADALATQQSIKAYVDSSIASGAGGSNTQIQYNNSGAFGGDSGFTTDGAGSIDIVGDLDIDNININGNTISSTDTNGNIVLDPDGSGEIQLGSAIVTVEQYIQHSGDANNQIEFGTDTQDFQTDGSSRLDISNSGVRMGATGARITSISDDTSLTADSSTLGITQHAAKTYIDTLLVSYLPLAGGTMSGDINLDGNDLLNINDIQITDGSFYVSLIAPSLSQNNLYTLPTDYPTTSGYILSSTDGGVMSWIPNTTGSVISVTGTANEVDVDNTDSQNPVVSLSATIDAPGTFTIQSSTAISSIINDATMATATATNISTSSAIKSYIDTNLMDYLPLSGGTMTGNLILNADPTASLGAVTKQYVDNIVVNVHPACAYSTTANLTGYTYDNVATPPSGVGATLTAGSNGAFSTDGASPSLNDRILVSFQTAQEENGIYTLTQVGDGSNPAILTRSSDYNEPNDVQAGDRVTVVGGTLYAATQWMMTQTSPITFGTTAITWLQITNTGALLIANNLNDVNSVSASVANLGLTDSIQNIKVTPLTSGSGTFTPDANCVFAIIELQGGGGGSGGTTGAGGQSAASGAGGGGGYIKFWASAAQLNAGTDSYSVGAAGAAGASGNNAGGAGGASQFTINGGTTWEGLGGSGGAGASGSSSAQNSGTPGAGGNTSTGTNATLIVNINGSQGGLGSTVAGAGTVGRVFGDGGGAFMASMVTYRNDDGQNYGGGAASYQNQTGSNQPGEAGGSGVILITEFLRG